MSAPYLSVPNLCVLALALLLQACTTTSGPAATADSDASIALKGQTQLRRTPLAAATESGDQEFKGPQVVFSQGSAVVPPAATPLLDDIAMKLKADPLSSVVLVGHTEDLGSAEFAMAVASQCTQAVGQALIKRGARSSQIRMLPRGYETASKRCTSAACKKQMRRVDIVLSTY